MTSDPREACVYGRNNCAASKFNVGPIDEWIDGAIQAEFLYKQGSEFTWSLSMEGYHSTHHWWFCEPCHRELTRQWGRRQPFLIIEEFC